MTLGLGLRGLTLVQRRGGDPAPPSGAPANAISNNQGGYVRNASGGYVLKDAS